jgi:hypothetical protein
MPCRLSLLPAILIGTAFFCVAGIALMPCAAQQIYRNAFESNHTSWFKGDADVEYVEAAHQMVEQGRPASGPRAEYLKVIARQGSHIYYQLPTKRAPISDELSISLWVKANRPGVQLLARVVLPKERDPYSLDDRLTTLLHGDSYRLAGRWQQLRLGQAVVLTQKQQQMMQAQLHRPINFKDAYVDRLILNVYGGPGENEVWIQDLEMGPVLNDPVPAAAGSAGKTPGQTTALPRPSATAAVVEFSNSRLLVNGKRFFFRGIRLTETRPEVLPKVLTGLRYAGFNTLWLDAASPPAVVHQAAELGFRLVPVLPSGEQAYFVSTRGLSQEVDHFPEPADVLFWDVGDSLRYSGRDMAALTRLAQLVRQMDAGRPLTADVNAGLAVYARNVNLIGAHRYPLMTSLELPAYREWLEQRQRFAALGQPRPFLWTWIQTHAPDWYTALIYGRQAADGFPEPVGPQPEQVRLMTYQALAAGCRGLAFSSDRFLANSCQGRDRLLGVGLLNLELEMLEPLLVTAEGPPRWIDTSIPEVKAAVFRTAKGILVLVMWCGRGAQYVPGQAAVKDLKIVVPQVPQDMEAWEVTPAEVRGLHWKRVIKGTEVKVGEFGLTTALVFTADVMLIKRFQEQCHDLRQVAAQWSYDLALEELRKVLPVERELEKSGHTQPDAQMLLDDVHKRLDRAKQQWDNRLYADAYHSAQQALRPLRILMRAQWDSAVKAVDGNPSATPYAASFYTLPQHWQMVAQVQAAKTGANLLVGGGFETDPAKVQDGWTLLPSLALDRVDLKAERMTPPKAPSAPAATVAASHSQTKNKDQAKAAPSVPPIEPKEGKQVLMLQVKPKTTPPPVALEGTFLAVQGPPVRLPPGTLVKVSAWVNIPAALTGSVDGALFYDSVGGEPLGVRLNAATGWKQYVLYRRVPADGTIRVTLALTGLGTVYFDDVRIEPLASP